MATQHRVIKIDPAAFADQVPKDPDSEESFFDEGNVLKFLIDAMNKAKISISMIRHAHEHAIEYQGRREHFSIGISSLDTPESGAKHDASGDPRSRRQHRGG